MSAGPSPSVISEEVARFDALGDKWWDEDGPMAPLHRLNPVRIGWARDLIARRFKLEAPAGLPLRGVSLIDIGCGAGLFAEPMARLGADVVGVDPAAGAIEAARRHAEETGAHLAYRAATVEEMAAEERQFDVVSAMEVIEHAANPQKLRRRRRFAGQARRASPRLDPQPHAEELRPRHRRRRIRAPLARARNPPLGAIRDPVRTHRLRPSRGPEAAEPARHGLRPVPPRLAPLVRYGGELPLRGGEGGGLDSRRNCPDGSGRFGRIAVVESRRRGRLLCANTGHSPTAQRMGQTDPKRTLQHQFR